MSKKIYMRFMGGLGNQMFHYAQLRALTEKGREVYPNFDWYDLEEKKYMPFVLEDVFPNVKVPRANKSAVWISRKAQRVKKGINWLFRKEVFYIGEHETSVFEPDIAKMPGGTWDGYWQSEKYFADIEDEIRATYQFKTDDPQLQAFIQKLEDTPNTVSVHIRRGDYAGVMDWYGGISTTEYYEKAMNYMKEKLDNPTFYVFSNEIDWVKENFVGDNIVCVTGDMFEHYENWYDMCLMSHCKNNITANSSFSWWGAWLNCHVDRIVIAPHKWNNMGATPDIWPNGWIKMQG